MKVQKQENRWFSQANALYRANDFRQAIKFYDLALQDEPENWEIWNSKGLCCYQLGSTDIAASCFQRATAIDKTQWIVWLNFGMMCNSVGSYETAVKLFDIALQIRPKDSFILLNKGDSLSELGRLDTALDVYTLATYENVGNAFAWLKRGDCEYELGHKKEAIQSYRKVVAWHQKYSTDILQHAAERLKELEHDLRDSNRQGEQDVSFNIGDLIGDEFEVYGILGRGGFGVVYWVFSRKTGRTLALKALHKCLVEDVHLKQRFRREANLWIQLRKHPNIVQAHHVDEIAGQLFISLEYIPPDRRSINTLDDFFRKKLPTELQEYLPWAIEVCHAMEYARKMGIKVHRDIKPANIMIAPDGHALLTDFGLAASLDGTPVLTSNDAKLLKNRLLFWQQTRHNEGLGTVTHMPRNSL